MFLLAAENKTAMLRSEVMSWPITLAVLAVAFGSLAAAGIPLLLSILGLVATAGALWIGAQVTDITIWAMNFALMFALAVGIDYALFVVVRFRAALRAGLRPDDAVAETMDSAGRAILVSGLAVMASLAAIMIVPSQPFRTSALGILLAVGGAYSATNADGSPSGPFPPAGLIPIIKGLYDYSWVVGLAAGFLAYLGLTTIFPRREPSRPMVEQTA